LSAAKALFDAGLADPRGCEYREIEVGTGNVWSGDGGVVTTRGWVLPGTGAERFSVCWNGLVYPTVSVGRPADWRADARIAIRRTMHTWGSASAEGYSLHHEAALPIKGCLLLRLGAPELALEVWSAIQSVRQRRFEEPSPRKPGDSQTPANPFRLDESDPYLAWAVAWVGALFDRTVCAHMRGDDNLALAGARQLTAIQILVEKQAERRGFKRQKTQNSPWDGKYIAHLEFLGPLPRLLADQERRASRPRRTAASLTAILALTNAPERINALVEKLEDAATRQSGQPGGLWPWSFEPICAALIKEGPAAIEPLLNCLEGESSQRLTRSVSFWRDFHHHRNLHSVSEPVVEALLAVMSATHSAVGFDRRSLWSDAPPLKDIASSFRRYWSRYGPVAEINRWFLILSDDSAGDRAWEDAIAQIVRVESGGLRWPLYDIEILRQLTNPVPRLRGESLRLRQNPSVTELMLKRATMWTPRSDWGPFGPAERVRFCQLIARWDPRAALPMLRQLMEDLLRESRARPPSSDFAARAQGILVMTLERARAGDRAALDDYATWLRGLTSAAYRSWQDSFYTSREHSPFEPFWLFRDHATLATTADFLFQHSESPLQPDLSLTNGLRSLAVRAAGTPLVTVAPFRSWLFLLLADKTVVGTNSVDYTGEVKYHDSLARGSYRGPSPDRTRCELIRPVTYRLCDSVARQLSRWPHMPEIQLYWHESVRDEAVERCVRTLRESGHAIRPFSERRLESDSGYSP
jgi:hypothetical protein